MEGNLKVVGAKKEQKQLKSMKGIKWKSKGAEQQNQCMNLEFWTQNLPDWIEESITGGNQYLLNFEVRRSISVLQNQNYSHFGFQPVAYFRI